MKTQIKILIFITTTCCLVNCNKSIYINTDDEGTSKYIIYKNKKNYKYIEKTKLGEFSETGIYELNDSLISFVYKNQERTPYTYLGDNIHIRNDRKSNEYQIIHLTDKASNSPILFGTLTFKNHLGEIIDGTESDFDGLVYIKNNKDIHTIEINYVGYLNQVFNYEQYYDYDLNIQLEALKPGGRMSDGCLIYHIDRLLEYSIDEPDNITKLERNGVVYEKQVKNP